MSEAALPIDAAPRGLAPLNLAGLRRGLAKMDELYARKAVLVRPCWILRLGSLPAGLTRCKMTCLKVRTRDGTNKLPASQPNGIRRCNFQREYPADRRGFQYAEGVKDLSPG